MKLFKLLAAVTVWLAMLIDYTAHGCRCAPLGTVCEYVQQAKVVLRGTVVSRPRQDGPNDPVSYTMDTLTFYKHPMDPDARIRYSQEISFTTAGSTATCGVVLGLGQEYLIGLYPDYTGQLTANSCGLLSAWEAVSEEEEELLLEAGCDEYACGGTCDEEHQACIFYEGEHKCADVTCDPSPCADDEYCNLEKWDCTQEPCPVIAVCRDACNGECADGETCMLNKDVVCVKAPCLPVPECVKDPCAGHCGEFQKCLPFAGEPEPPSLRPAEKDDSSTVWYCADFCDPARCEDNEVCELLPTPCRGSDEPCPMVAVCSETCSGGCDEPQECVFYPEKGYKCAHVTCDPGPCADNETCFIQKSLPPVVICSDNCNGECDDSQVCRQYKGNGKWYCSDTCANMPCEEGETCATRPSKWCRTSGYDGCPENRRCLRRS